MTAERRTALRTAASAAVAALGVALVAVEGRRGFMPLDQSIVFDAGWRILDGQVPLRDFVTPNGILPGAVQAAVFAVLGVSWSSYLVHAAVLNALFGLVVLALLRRLGLPTLASAVYAAASVVVFAPPFGSPSVEQPSFFFGLVALLLAVIAASGSPGRLPAAAALPATVVLAVLGKQIPALLMLPVVLGVALSGRGRPRTLRWLLGGALAAALVLAAAAALLGVPPSRAALHVWTLPQAVGAERLARSPSPLWGVLVPPWALLAPIVVLSGAAVLAVVSAPRAGSASRWWGAVGVLLLAALLAVLARPPSPPVVRGLRGPPAQAPLLAAVAGYAVVLAVGWLAVSSFPRRPPVDRERTAAPLPWPVMLLLPVALVIVSTTFVVLTNNQIENGAAYLFVALGALHAALRWLPRAAPGRGPAVAVALLLPAVAVVDAVRFHLDVNRTRIVHDAVFDPAQASTAGLPDGFDLALDGPLLYSSQDLGAVVAEVRAAPGEVLVFGDTTLLAALAGKSSIAPGLWWHPELVSPPPGTAAHAAFDERLAETLAREDVTTVIVEAAANPWRQDPAADLGDRQLPPWAVEATWTGARLADFPRSAAVAQERACAEDRIGPFTVVHLCAPGSPAVR